MVCFCTYVGSYAPLARPLSLFLFPYPSLFTSPLIGRCVFGETPQIHTCLYWACEQATLLGCLELGALNGQTIMPYYRSLVGDHPFAIFSLTQPDYIDVNMKMGLYNMTVREYIDTQHVQIDAWRVLSANASSLNISIHNKWDRSSLSFEIYPRGLSGITMIADYQASYGEQFNIQLLFDESIEKHRLVTAIINHNSIHFVIFVK